MITPLDIQNHEFKKSIRGYNENEVDDFLDRIVADYEKILRENEKLRERAGVHEKEITHYRGLEQNLQDTLIVAQRTAEDVLNAARKNAREIRENAANESQTIHENTIREAQNIRVQAQLDAKRHIDETIFKLTTIVSEYDKIVREKNSFLWKMRAALESELAVVNQLLNSIPGPMDIETLRSSAIQAVKNVQASEPVAKVETVAKTEEKIETPKTEEKENAQDEGNTTVVKITKKN